MLYSIIGILVIIFDQLVKYWVDENINYLNPSVDLIPNVLSLVRVQNDGAAFSFLQGGSARIWFIGLTAVFALLVVLALATNFISGRFGRWCLVFITAGGLSNMIDRVRFGYVIDMFKINLFDFAVFNVADIFITVFSIAFILYILFGGEKEREPYADEFDEDDYEDERLSRRARKAAARLDEEEEEAAPARRSRRARKAAAKLDEEEEDFPEPQPRRGRKAADEEAVSPKKDRKGRRAARDDDEMFEEMFGTKIAPAPASVRKAEVAEKAPARRPAPQSARKASPASEPQSAPAPARRQAAPAKPAENDPFAEWEKANARVNASRRTSFEEEFSEPAPDTSSRDAFSDFVSSSAKKAAASEPVKQAPAAKPAPAPAKPEPAATVSFEEEFDLDSILNEFK
ncbi:MAG: signal peptidase II [Oscillospiraceae bacterium]|nr:signal peptidase II [Oscillospiraceae bacterium]